jgi:hypothetical protein
MSWATRGLGFTGELARELGMLLPRTLAGLNESTGWVPASPRGVRQFGEVMLDEQRAVATINDVNATEVFE